MSIKVNKQQTLALYLIQIRCGLGVNVQVELQKQHLLSGDIIGNVLFPGFEPTRVILHANGGFQGELPRIPTMGNGLSSDEEDEDIASAVSTVSTMEKESSNG